MIFGLCLASWDSWQVWLGQALGQSSEGPALTGKSDTSFSFMALSEMRRFLQTI